MNAVAHRLRTSPMALRLGASLFCGGALVTLLGVLLPHPPEVSERGYLALAAVQLAVAVVLLLVPSRLRDSWMPPIVVGGGVLVITGALYLNGESRGGEPLFNEVFYVWPALYAGYYFDRRALAGAVGLTVAVHAGVLVAIGIEGGLLVTRWVITTAVVTGVAIAAFALRRQVDRLVWRLREAMRTDLLTSVLNRRGFEEAFGVELQRHRRTGAPLAILLGDVDRFKSLNDRFGHAAGDAALTAIAARMRDRCRTTDVLARIGGEEFAILMPATSMESACQTADRLRAAISRLEDPAGGSLSMSFGVAVCEAPGDADADRLLRAADDALYEAKRLGRDRTVAHHGARPRASAA